MKSFKSECIKETSDSHIKFEEKSKTIVFDNPQRKTFTKVKIDGCQITEGERCDNLLINNNTGDEYFVELKGVDVGHALEQLKRSMALLSDTTCKTKSVRAYIVSTNISPKLTSKRQKFLLQSQKLYGPTFTLTVKERRMEVNV